jgi:hypothetical protein
MQSQAGKQQAGHEGANYADDEITYKPKTAAPDDLTS